MAIKPIEEMTRPVSRRDDVLEKLRANDPDKELRAKGMLPPLQKYASEMAMSDAPEDYLKRAVEQFIIDFPEFEDLQGQELYDKMYDKGYFSDRYASSDLISKTRTRTRKPEGIMQLAGGFSGDDIIQSAIMWAIETEFGSMEELERQLRTGESTIPGIIAAYQDAIVDMN